MKPITKKRLKETRLANLEEQMFKKIIDSKKKMTARDLKGYFDGRASLETTKAILHLSDRLGVSVQEDVGTIVSVSYEITGIQLENIYIGGDGSNSSRGTLANVLMNADDKIELRVYQKSALNQEYSFTTSYIGSFSNEYEQTNKPIKSSEVNETIKAKKKE